MELQGLFLIFLFVLLFASIFSGMKTFVAIAGAPLIAALIGSFFGAFDLTLLGAFPQRIFGIMRNQLLLAIPLFLLMGLLFEKSGLAKSMMTGMQQAFGQSKSSLCIGVLFISTLLAATTGLVGATIVVLGLVALPILIERDVPARLSTGLVVACGTLGQIIPPSIVLLILADQISNAYQQVQRANGSFAIEPVSVGHLFAGSFIPGLLLVLLYAGYVLFVLGRETENKPVGKTLKKTEIIIDEVSLQFTLVPILLILAVLGSILLGVATASEAAILGVAGTLILSAGQFVSQKKQPKNDWCRRLIQFAGVGVGLLLLAGFASSFLPQGAGLILAIGGTGLLSVGLIGIMWDQPFRQMVAASVTETVSLTGVIFSIVIAASLLALVFRGFSGDVYIAEWASQLPGDKWTALILVMLLVFVLGFVLEFIEIVFIIVPIAGPLLLQMGFDPVWLAVLLAINLQTSFLTPPFGIGLFYFKSVAPSGMAMMEIYKSVIPFVLLQLVALFVVVIFPQLALWLPQKLFGL